MFRNIGCSLYFLYICSSPNLSGLKDLTDLKNRQKYLSMENIVITRVSSDEDIRGILALQQQNLRKNLSAEQAKAQGFLTVAHQFDVLKAMNDAEPSVIAKDGEKVVGYCLAMLPKFGNDIPELHLLFSLINTLTYKGKLLKDTNYCVMGQVCVGEGYRSIGLFDKMNLHLKESLQHSYSLCVTDISQNNTRSMRAHERVGYVPIHDFFDESLDETWIIVVWEW